MIDMFEESKIMEDKYVYVVTYWTDNTTEHIVTVTEG